MAKPRGRLALKLRPGFCLEHADNLGFVRQWRKQRLNKPQTHFAAIGNQLERSYIGLVGVNLAVADDAVARKLEAGNPEFCYAHDKSLID